MLFDPDGLGRRGDYVAEAGFRPVRHTPGRDELHIRSTSYMTLALYHQYSDSFTQA